MTLAILSEPVPLRQDPDGSVRIGKTRVLLNAVIASFRQGSSAEHIVDQYQSLDLPDVYAVLGYYLRNRNMVDAYLAKRTEKAEKLQAEIESKLDPHGIRDRLLARRAALRG